MDRQEKIDLMESRGIVATDFATVTIPLTAVKSGMPIGIGACKAVQLYINLYELNTDKLEEVDDNLQILYYGSANGQFRELIAGRISDLIFCEDLQDVYVRGNGIADNNIQVTIYLSADQVGKERFLGQRR